MKNMLTSKTNLEFFVPGTPAPGGSKRAIIHHQAGCPAGRRKQQFRGHCTCRPFSTVIDAAGERNKNWRASVTHMAMEEMRRLQFGMMEGPLDVWMRFYLQRPKHHFGVRGALLQSAPAYPESRPDLLKLARATEDALTGILWKDDASNVGLFLSKRFCDEFHVLPGVLISVSKTW